jgi:hypothetical protein
MLKHPTSFIEGSLEVIKLPTIRTDEKAEVGRVREERRRRKKIREERVRRNKMQVREKVERSRITVFSNDLWLRRVEK